MSKGIVFKQRYNSRNLPSTPTLNRKHLVYIATRPGAVHNPGCGFGLWGRLPGGILPEDIDNLKATKKIITQASKAHTLYRAIISVDGETAKRHDLYSRKTWETLLERQIHILAKEMDIKPKDFCWVASMHYEKGHPHVHVMYWDNSDAVREEYIPQKRFEIMSEHVRAAFNGEIYAEELRDRQKDQRAGRDELRLELKAMLKEANLEEALALSHVSAPTRDAITKRLVDLAATVPTKGSIDYAYLSKQHQEYKEKLDDCISEILKISDFRKVAREYEAATKDVSDYYGNGEATKAFELEKARKALYKSLGNVIMDAIREYRKELTLEAPTERTDLQTVLQTAALGIAVQDPLYEELRKQMPKERTPMWALLEDEEYRSLLGKLTGRVCDDIRINTRIRGYLEAAGKDLNKEEAKELWGEVYKDAKREISHLIQDRLQEDAGYPQQLQADLVTNLLIRLLGDASRSSGQQQAQRDLLRHRRGDLSKTAQRDRRAQLEQGGGWEQ